MRNRNDNPERGCGDFSRGQRGMVEKQAFLRCTSRVYMCNATQRSRGDLHRRRHKIVCQFGSDAAVACNRVLNHAPGAKLSCDMGSIDGRNPFVLFSLGLLLGGICSVEPRPTLGEIGVESLELAATERTRRHCTC